MSKRRIVFFTLVAMLAMGTASAHPLGNFTTNVHLGLGVADDDLNVRLVVDMAEIPTFREEVGEGYAEERCATLKNDIRLRLEAAPLALVVTRTDLSFPPGEGGLDTLRLECDYQAPLPATIGDLTIENDVFADRLGWAEIVVVGADSELPTESPSMVLTEYPPGEVSEIRRGAAVLTGASGSLGASPTIVERVGANLSEGSGFLAMLAALGLGVGHALAPGHGKTLMAAYLVGRRGGVRLALLLGLAVAISHTIGVGVLGLITALTTAQFQPESVYPWLSALSAGIVTVIGLTMLYRALRNRRSGVSDHHEHDHGHDHGHSHDHGHTHDHPHGDQTKPVGWRSLAALGLAGGLVPSASAVVLLLGGISRGEPWWGLILVAVFGIGMAAALVGAGLVVVGAARFGLRLDFAGQFERFVPIVAAVAVTLIGGFLLWQAVLSA
ncbi:hypothetical protein BH18ACT5_BH18ACT5_15610 [soil metagenome]